MATASESLRTGYWGEPSATIDWCELNYQYSPYIAEFWNTLSNLLFVVLGLYGLACAVRDGADWCFRLLFLSTVVIGIGSAMFHGTLLMVSQQFDETPMIWGVLIWIYIMYNNEIRRLPFRASTVILGFTGFGVAFAVFHAFVHSSAVFLGLFGVFMFACFVRIAQMYRHSTNARARGLCLLTMYTAASGFCLWLLDLTLCSEIRKLPINPQGHAWWHVCMGVATYSAPLFMQLMRDEEQQRKPVARAGSLCVDLETPSVAGDSHASDFVCASDHV